jgi:hypothetical protein
MNARVVEITRHFLVRATSPWRPSATVRSCWPPPGMIKGRKLSAYPGLPGGGGAGRRSSTWPSPSMQARHRRQPRHRARLARAPGLDRPVPGRAGHTHQPVGICGSDGAIDSHPVPNHVQDLHQCRPFSSYESRTRSVRLHGVVTSLRLENLHWAVLEEIAGRDGLSVAQLIEKPLRRAGVGVVQAEDQKRPCPPSDSASPSRAGSTAASSCSARAGCTPPSRCSTGWPPARQPGGLQPLVECWRRGSQRSSRPSYTACTSALCRRSGSLHRAHHVGVRIEGAACEADVGRARSRKRFIRSRRPQTTPTGRPPPSVLP